MGLLSFIVLGGEKTMGLIGKSYEYIIGRSTNNLTLDFVKRRTGQQTMRWKVFRKDDAFGEHECGILAREWCRKLQHFWQIELSGEVAPGHPFSQVHHDSYVEAVEFQGMAANAQVTGTGVLVAKAEEIRRLLR